jgi:hypothetical protein
MNISSREKLCWCSQDSSNHSEIDPASTRFAVGVRHQQSSLRTSVFPNMVVIDRVCGLFHRFDEGVHDSGCQVSPGLPGFAFAHGSSFRGFGLEAAGSGVDVEGVDAGASWRDSVAGFTVGSLVSVGGSVCRVFGLSRKDGLLAQRSSASRASSLICAWRIKSCCCSSRLGGSCRTYRSH